MANMKEIIIVLLTLFVLAIGYGIGIKSSVDTEAQAVDQWILKFAECGEEYPSTSVDVSIKKFVFRCK